MVVNTEMSTVAIPPDDASYELLAIQASKQATRKVTVHSSPPDLSRHLSREARAMLPNPVKSIWKMAARRPGTLNLGNGDPHFTLYPVSEISFKVASCSEPDPVSAWRAGIREQVITTYRDEDCALGLQTAFQYGAGSGVPFVREALGRLTQLIHSPPNHVVSLDLGNADGITKAFRLLGDYGDSFLVEEFSFSALTNAALPLGIKWVPVRMDEGGLIPEEMEHILTSWDIDVRGKRPHVLYTIPCSQNPTGSTLSLGRRKEIYEIARRWDIIILEDDPYYFLQYDITANTTLHAQDSLKELCGLLPRSFVSMDYDGRVIRFDSFSKILAPGMRLGWVTCNPMFAEKWDMLTDSSSQQPHGIGQAFIAELFGERGWGINGFARWVMSLCDDYRRRRDLFMDSFQRNVAPFGYASAQIPQSGMFVWIKVHLQLHPRYRVARDGHTVAGPRTNVATLMNELFHKIFDSGLIVMPASTFVVVDTASSSATEAIHDRTNYFRATFSGTDEVIVKGLGIFSAAVKDFFAS